MRLIGLCGRSGSGKGVFCETASELGLRVIDCDTVYKELVSRPSECLLEIARHFGNEVIRDGALDRRYLAPIVFSDKEKLTLLNNITHKHILNEVFTIINSCNEDDTVLLDAPTLFESGLDASCDQIVAIIAPDEQSVARIVLRDGISEEEARRRLSNQPTIDFLIENSDLVIYNDSSLESFKNASYEAIKTLTEK